MLHLGLIALGKGRSSAAGGVQADAHAQKGLGSAALVGACRLHAPGDRTLHVALAHAGVAQHCALVAHVDELLALLVIGDAA